MAIDERIPKRKIVARLIQEHFCATLPQPLVTLGVGPTGSYHGHPPVPAVTGPREKPVLSANRVSGSNIDNSGVGESTQKQTSALLALSPITYSETRSTDSRETTRVEITTRDERPLSSGETLVMLGSERTTLADFLTLAVHAEPSPKGRSPKGEVEA
jgi:hypothetical protein